MKNLITVLFSLLIISSLSFAQWSEQTSGVTSNLESVSSIDNNTAWVCGTTGKFLLTTNGGTNWVAVTSPNAALTFDNIWGIDANNALTAGYTSAGAFVYKTTNAGANWTQVFTQTGGFIDAITYVSGPTGLWYGMYGDPVGGRWSIWTSTNVGSTWDSTGNYIPQAGSEAGWNNALYCVLVNGVQGAWLWFGTNNSRIYRGFTNGSSWNGFYGTTTGIPNIYTILFSDTLSGIAGGDLGLAFTSNGGLNWVVNTSANGTGSITGIAVKTTEIWYARGNALWYTSNNGSNWTSYTQTGTYYHLAMARAANNFNIWAVRGGGGISKYTYPIGIRPISSEVPDKYSLSQNYPNPFNPSTTIKFALPHSSFTVLTIYDALGREIAKLINEKLSTGIFEVTWDASNYGSGVYYYKITSGDFNITRKMIVLK